MNKQIETALKMAIEAVEGQAFGKYRQEVIAKLKEALAEAERQEKEAQQDAEAWLKQLNNEMKNDDAKLTLDEGRKIMRALEALKEKNTQS